MALYKENAEVFNSNFSNVSTLQLKKQKWEAIQCAENAIGKQQRTIDELKHKWKYRGIKAQTLEVKGLKITKNC